MRAILLVFQKDFPARLSVTKRQLFAALRGILAFQGKERKKSKTIKRSEAWRFPTGSQWVPSPSGRQDSMARRIGRHRSMRR